MFEFEARSTFAIYYWVENVSDEFDFIDGILGVFGED